MVAICTTEAYSAPDVDLADALELAREEGIHGHKLARGMDFDVTLAELGVEALERLDLLRGELDLALTDRILRREQRSWWVLETVADRHAPHAARTDFEPSEHQLVAHPLGVVARVLER